VARISATRITAVAIAAAGLTAAKASAAPIVERTPHGYTLSIGLGPPERLVRA
jgi:hypothetical protein